MRMKTYIQINGKWYRTYRVNDWYDVLCWVLAIGLLGTVGFAALTGRLAC